ncbi:MAG: putative porin [Ferruginibacter sp.]
MKKLCFVIPVLLFVVNVFCQIPVRRPVIPNNDQVSKTQTGARKDSLGFEHRNDAKDSISIYYRFLDSVRRYRIDSSINDFDKYFPLPSSWQALGNTGAAVFPLLFKPNLKPGWDAGFHAYDVYRFTVEETKYYKTNHPFSMLGYQLASGKEQMIKAMHTQNPRPNLNFGFDYRLISAPGFFVTQNTNHNNYRLYGNYQGKRKRYSSWLVFAGNTIRASENGGIAADSFLLDPDKKKRFSIPVNLGNAAAFEPNPFVTKINTGNTYRDVNLFIRQSYDIGKRDSVAINDSTTEYLFYPKLRLQHSFTYSTYKYTFRDITPDSLTYKKWYDITIDSPNVIVSASDEWKIMTNDFSLVQFPDTKNIAQYVSAGIALQTLEATLATGIIKDYNSWVHGAYKNLTRNKLWDITLNGQLYFTGFNSGDYSVYAGLDRFLNNKWGDVKLFFTNVNRTPSFIFDKRSSFSLGSNNNFKKENITSFGATSTNSLFQLGFVNTLLTNYSYFYNYHQSEQYSKPINILQIFGSKKFSIRNKWNWYAEAVVQQTDAASPIRLPLVYTRNRFSFEGKYFKNLNISTGLEIRYFTPYKANNYSPFNGQFVPQDTVTIKNTPDINAFLHFRIKGFTAYLRAENLNTASFKNGFGFINNNFAAPLYPTPGLMIRFGIQWWFVN